MPSAATDKLRYLIRRELESLELDPEVVLSGEVSTDSDPGLRSPGDQLRAKVPPLRRTQFLRKAIQRSGRTNYLVSAYNGRTYRARINGRDFIGSFAQVWDQTAPLLLRFADSCL